MTKKQDLKHTAHRLDSKSTKAFTVAELFVALATLSILAATAISGMQNYLTRSKTVEVYDGLNKLVQGEVTYYAKTGNFLEAGPTNIPPNFAKTVVDFGADPRWGELSFGFKDPIYYGYQAVSSSGTTLDCEAFGDLDGDSDMSTFRRSLSANGPTATVGGVYVLDELE